MKGKLTNDSSRDSLNKQYTNPRGGNKMKAKFKKLMKNQKGMTLIELLAVIVIIAIIALIAIPAIGNIINKSQDKAILSDASQMVSGAKVAIADGACSEGTTEIVCSSNQLKDYVENAEMAAGDDKDADYVVKNKSTNGYKFVYAKLGDVKTKSIINAITGSDTGTMTGEIDYKKLVKAMGNSGSKAN